MTNRAASLPERPPLLRRALLSLALLAACVSPSAQERTAPLPAVTISGSGVRDPVEKSYRKMIRGMDLFERRRELAPDATLRFKLLPRRRDTDMRNIRLDLVGRSVETRIAVAADDSFVLPRDRLAFDEDAVVMPDRRSGTMTWRAEIRSPGVPPGMRRLGDLRLECEVGMEAGLVSNQRGLLDRLLGAFTAAPAHCGGKDPRYLFFSEQPLFGVSLVAGQRREALPVSKLFGGASNDPDYMDDLPFCDCQVLLDRSYFLPLGDRSWPDDTLVEFEPMAAPQALGVASPVPGIVPGRSTRADLALVLPQATAIRFDSGYEVWVDRDKPRRGDPQDVELAERVVLVDPAGKVANVRWRLPGGLVSP